MGCGVSGIGENVEFSEGRGDSFQTNPGACLSLFIIIISVIYGANQFIDREEETKHSTQVEEGIYNDFKREVRHSKDTFTMGALEFFLPNQGAINPKTGDTLLIEDFIDFGAWINKDCDYDDDETNTCV